MKTYKTKDGTKTGFVPGVGAIVDGKITVPAGVIFENANFELVPEEAPQAPVQPQPAPAAPTASTPETSPTPVALPAPVNEQPLNKEPE